MIILCPDCGVHLDDDDLEECPECGFDLDQQDENEE